MLDFHNALSSIRAQPIFRPPSISPSTPFLAHPFLPPVLLRSQCSLYIRPLRTHCYKLVRLNPLRLYSLTDCRSIYPDYPAAPGSCLCCSQLLSRLPPHLLQKFWTLVYHPVLAAPKNRIEHPSLLESRLVGNPSRSECLISDHTQL